METPVEKQSSASRENSGIVMGTSNQPNKGNLPKPVLQKIHILPY